MMQELQLPSPTTTTVVEDFGLYQPSSVNNKQQQQPSAEEEDSAVTLATAVPYSSPEQHQLPFKEPQGHLFLGCLCDMRRTVIIINIISLIFSIINLCFASAFLALYDNIQNNNNDNDSSATTNWFSLEGNDVSKKLLASAIAFAVVSMIFLSVGIRGAIKFHAGMVGAAMVFHGISVIFNLTLLNILGALLATLFLYPHVMLFREIRNGIMTKENYVNERQTCCC